MEGVNWEGSLREWVLTTLGAGSLISPKINFSLRTSSPEGFNLNTSEIVTFLEKETSAFGKWLYLFVARRMARIEKIDLESSGKITTDSRGSRAQKKNFNLSWNLSLDGEPWTQQEIQSLRFRR